MRNRYTIIVAAVVLTAIAAYSAPWRRESASGACRTNATSAVAFSLPVSGKLAKLVITMGGSANPTSNVIVADSDGTVLASNIYNGTTTTYYTNETRIVIGLDVSTFGANTNTATVTVTPTYEK